MSLPLYFTKFSEAAHNGQSEIFRKHLEETSLLELSKVLHLSVTLNSELCDIFFKDRLNICKKTDENGNTILHFCAFQNYFQALKKLVFCGLKANYKNNNGHIPLQIACQHDFASMARFLLHSDPETVNYQDRDGNTALHFAAQNDNAALVKELIKQGANINEVNQDGITPLHTAIIYHSGRVFHLLLEHHADVNARDKDGNTPVHLAVIEQELTLTRRLIVQNANVDCQNVFGQTPLHIACEQSGKTLISCLMDRSSLDSLTTTDSNGNTVLHIATMKNNHALIEELVRRGVQLNLINSYGQTALHIAIQSDSLQSFDKLIVLGANVNLKDGEGKSPIHIAISKGILSVVGRLVNSGADLESRDHYGHTPIHYAANCQSFEVLKYLCFSGSKTSTNFCQQTLIHVALESCSHSGTDNKECRKCWYVFEWLLSMGVDIKAQDMKGDTALHYAARYGCVSFYQHFCDQDENTFEILLGMKNEDGQTALHVAALCNWQMFDLLLGEKADPDSKDNRNTTPLENLIEKYESVEGDEYEEEEEESDMIPMIHYFVSLKLLNIVDLLLERSSCIETKYNGKTPLMYAVEKGLKREAKHLIDKGANVNTKNYAGFTVLHVAIMRSDKAKNYVAIANFIISGGANINAKSPGGKTPLHMVLEKERVYPFLLRIVLDRGAVIDALDSKKKTPLDYISEENMQNPIVKTIIRHHLILLDCVNMLTIPIDFQYNGFEDFHKCCIEEIKRMKAEQYGRNSLFDVFFKFGNPTYIFNQLLETKINSLKTNEEGREYLIYGSILKQTYQRAKERYKLIQDAQGFFSLLNNSPFQPTLPDEAQRMILYHLWESDLETLVETATSS